MISDVESLPIDTARVRLTTVWIVGTSLVFIIVIFQSLMNHYGTKTQEVWEWLLPTTMPCLGMIISSLISNAYYSSASSVPVRKVIYRVTIWVSVSYVTLVLLTILLQPFSSIPPVELMHRSNIWLGPIQGLVGSALGVFFSSGHQKGTPSKE